MHAINNALGQSILNQEKFFESCDEFDKRNHCTGSREFFFIHSNDNIISFILNKLQKNSSYHSPNNPPELKDDSSNDCAAVIIFDDGHIWCAKKHDDSWYILDSVSNGPKLIEFEDIFSPKGFGWIIVWENNRLTVVDERIKSSSKRSSKHNRMNKNAGF
ncbi:unnamed protein product [Adineta steineri]|uniref:Ubiquitinyl hydrolase 1 n=1 Tax=Adineta steineri TaxID=433720 RepID=A0A819GML2_9BILA|nr:unnamed protein product [Adineta steineri]CAF3885909.1 unnamed protein product [Adineta steineri]CAF4271377.1 unnamed protein product [Adineta steineri]